MRKRSLLEKCAGKLKDEPNVIVCQKQDELVKELGAPGLPPLSIDNNSKKMKLEEPRSLDDPAKEHTLKRIKPSEVHPDLFKNATEPLHIHIEGKLKVTWTATLTKRRQRSIGLRGRIGPSPARNRPNSTVTTRNSYITTNKLGTLKKLPGYSGVSDFVNRTQEGLQR